MREKPLFRILSLVTGICMVLNPLSIASYSGIIPSEIKIPSVGFQLTLPPNLGTIQTLISGTGPTLIHIQTTHGNYEAQQKVQAILHYLKNTYDFQTLFVEGSAYELQPDLLRFFPKDKSRNLEIAESLAQKALVKGSEIFLLEESKSHAFGIENLDAYVANGKALQAVLRQRDKSKSCLDNINIQVEMISSHSLNKNLRDFLKRISNFEAQKLTLFSDWLSYLKAQAQEILNMDLSDPRYQIDWPMLVRIYKLKELETKIDLKDYSLQKKPFLKAVHSLPKEIYEPIQKFLSAPLTNQPLPDPETSLVFERMVSYLPQTFSFNDYPQVKRFIAHLILQSELKSDILFEEMDSLVEKISGRLATTESEKKVFGLLKDYRLLQKLFALELNPQDYEILIRQKKDMWPANLIKKFSAMDSGPRVSKIRFKSTREMDILFYQALQFYQLAKRRDQLMIRNLESQLKKRELTKAVIITGGFHAGSFEQYFKSKNYNYALISPQITARETSEGTYAKASSVMGLNFLKEATWELPHWSDPHWIPSPEALTAVRTAIRQNGWKDAAAEEAIRRSEIRIGIGDKRQPEVEEEPLPKQEIPFSILQRAQLKFSRMYPELAGLYDQKVTLHFFADLLGGSARLREMENQLIFLLEDRYASLPDQALPEARDLLIFLHLVHEMIRFVLLKSDQTLAELNLNREVVAFVAQTIAYQKLEDAEKKILQETAAKFDEQEKNPNELRFLPILKFMDQFDLKSILGETKDFEKIHDFIAQNYPGFKDSNWDPQKISYYLQLAAPWMHWGEKKVPLAVKAQGPGVTRNFRFVPRTKIELRNYLERIRPLDWKPEMGPFLEDEGNVLKFQVGASVHYPKNRIVVQYDLTGQFIKGISLESSREEQGEDWFEILSFFEPRIWRIPEGQNGPWPEHSIEDIAVPPLRDEITIIMNEAAFNLMKKIPQNIFFGDSRHYGINWRLIPSSQASSQYESFKKSLHFIETDLSVGPASLEELLREVKGFLEREWTLANGKSLRVNIKKESEDPIGLLKKFEQEIGPKLAPWEKATLVQKIEELQQRVPEAGILSPEAAYETASIITIDLRKFISNLKKGNSVEKVFAPIFEELAAPSLTPSRKAEILSPQNVNRLIVESSSAGNFDIENFDRLVLQTLKITENQGLLPLPILQLFQALAESEYLKDRFHNRRVSEQIHNAAIQSHQVIEQIYFVGLREKILAAIAAGNSFESDLRLLLDPFRDPQGQVPISFFKQIAEERENSPIAALGDVIIAVPRLQQIKLEAGVVERIWWWSKPESSWMEAENPGDVEAVSIPGSSHLSLSDYRIFRLATSEEFLKFLKRGSKRGSQRSEVRTGQPDLNTVIEILKSYYDAKRRLVEASEVKNHGAIQEALNKMKEMAAAAVHLQPPMDILETAVNKIKETDPTVIEWIGEPQEIFHAVGPKLNADHQQIIRQVAHEVANALTGGTAARELEASLISHTREMRLEDVAEDLPTLTNFGRADSVRFWGMAALSYEQGTPSLILMRPLSDLVAFRSAYLHEVIHDLSMKGILPILPQHELITHAATALELVRIGGSEALRNFGGGLYWRIFERGQEIFRKKEEPIIEDVEQLLEETRRVGSQYIEEEMAKSSQEVKPEEKSEEPPKKSLTQEDAARRYYEFERFAGTMLGGYAFEREQTAQQSGLRYIFDYAATILSRAETTFAPLSASPANQERAARLRDNLLDLARVLTRDSQLEIVDWNKAWTGADNPEVRYLPDLHKIVVPPQLWYLDETVAKGLIAQEIFRALHARPALIPSGLKANPTFMELWYVADTPRIVEDGSKKHPGSRKWIDRYFQYRHTIPSLPMARENILDFPLQFQFLAGILWFWHRNEIDPRITDERVIGALKDHTDTLRTIFQSTEERIHQKNTMKRKLGPGEEERLREEAIKEHYEMIEKKLWPVVRDFRQKSIEEGITWEVMDNMAREEKLNLSREQEDWIFEGRLRLQDLSVEQKQLVTRQTQNLSPEELERLKKLATAKVDDFAKRFEGKFGSQSLEQLFMLLMKDQNQAAQQQSSYGSDALFPAQEENVQAGNGKESVIFKGDLADALEALVKEAGELERLAQEAKQTAARLRGKATELQEQEAATALAEALDDLAKRLHEEANDLYRKAKEFRAQSQTTIEKVEERASNETVDPNQLVEQAGQFLQRTEQLGNTTGGFKTQTERLVERAKNEPATITPELTEALFKNTELLSDQTGDLHQRARRIEILARGIASVLQGQNQQGQGQPAKQDAGQESKSQQPGTPKEPLKKLDFSTVEPAFVPDRLPQGGGQEQSTPGYGPGLTKKVIQTGDQAPETPQKPSPKSSPPSSKNFQPSKPESKQRREEATEILKKIPKPPKKPAGVGKPAISNPSSQIQAFRRVTTLYSAQIARLRRDVLSALKQTILGGKIGNLQEGDYLDTDSLAQIKGTPPEVMAMDIAAGEFNYRISYLIDLSSSMGRGPGSLREMAAHGGAILLQGTRNISGIETELYGFDWNAGIPLKDYNEYKGNLSEQAAASVYSKIFRVGGGGTADVAAIEYAIERMKKGRESLGGLRIFGIGIGPGTEKVKEAYAPYGFQIDDAKEIPNLIRRVLARELTGKTKIHNIIFVLTDGNPGADNAAAIQKIAQDNRERWAKPNFERSEIRVTSNNDDLPFHYEKRLVDGKKVDFLVINGQAIEVGPGGELTPDAEVVPIGNLALPPPEGGQADSLPASYVVRLQFDDAGRKRRILVPLSPYNLRKLGEMIAVLSSKEKPNLYLRGPAAGGKNTLLYVLAGLAKRPIYLMSLHHDTSEKQLIALQTYGETGKEETGYRLSPFVQAAKDDRGAFGALDEVNKPANPGVLAATYSMLEHRFITLPDGNVVLAPPGFRAIAMGNPDRPPYLVTEVPVDFERRFQFVEMDYLHAPKRAYETDGQMQERLDDLAFLLRLQAPWFYSQYPLFFSQLVNLGQDIVEAFEEGLLPRPITVRGLMRIVRWLEEFPEDIHDFMTVFRSAYNFMRLDQDQKTKLEQLIENRFPGYTASALRLPPKLHSRVQPKEIKTNTATVTENYYQILDDKGHILIEQKIPKQSLSKIKVNRIEESQTVLRYKLALLKAMLLGEHVLIFGHTGVGKTSIVMDLLTNDLGLRVHHKQLNANSAVSALWGQQAIRDGKTIWEKQPTLLSMEEGTPNVIDDIGKPRHQAVISVLNNILQFGQIMTPYGIVTGKPGFFIIATTTPEEARYAAHELSGEVEDRFLLLYFEWMSPAEEKAELERRYPKIPRDLVSRFVDVADILRKDEEQQGELVRPITIQDLSVTLGRFQRENRTLFEIFLSAFGIEPSGEYVEKVKKEFDDHDLLHERFQLYQPTPTADEIVAERNAVERAHLLGRLIASFHGPTGASRFYVNFQSSGQPQLRQRLNLDSYELAIPETGSIIQLLGALRTQPVFSEDEKKTLTDIFTRLLTPPAIPATGVDRLDKPLRNILDALKRNDNNTSFITKSNMRSLGKWLELNGMPQNDIVRKNLILLLEWIQGLDIAPEEVRDIATKIIESRSELRASSLGLDLIADTHNLPVAVERAPDELRNLLWERLGNLLPALKAEPFPLVPIFFANSLAGLSAIDEDDGRPVFLLDESLKKEPERSLKEAWLNLQALLFAHEYAQFAIRNAETYTPDLTEEIILFFKMDRLLWSKLSKNQKNDLFHFATFMDSLTPDRPARFYPSLDRLDRYSQLSDDEKNWKAFAGELVNYPAFRGQSVDWDLFQKKREQTQILTMKVKGPKDTEGLIQGAIDAVAESDGITSKFAISAAFNPQRKLVVLGTGVRQMVDLAQPSMTSKKPPAIYIFDANGRRIVKVIEGFKEPVVQLILSPDGRTLVSRDKAGSVAIWHIHRNPAEVDAVQLPQPQAKPVDSIEFMMNKQKGQLSVIGKNRDEIVIRLRMLHRTRSELRASLFGLVPNGKTELPIPTEPTHTGLIPYLWKIILKWDPEWEGILYGTRAFYASHLPSFAATETDDEEPVFLLDERLKPERPGMLRRDSALLQALLLVHELLHFELRKTETYSPDLTEEMALFAEVDLKIWARLEPNERQALFDLARQLDARQTEDARQLLPSLERMERFRHLPDEDKTWDSLAAELQQHYRIFSDQTFNAVRFHELRDHLLFYTKQSYRNTIRFQKAMASIGKIQEALSPFQSQEIEDSRLVEFQSLSGQTHDVRKHRYTVRYSMPNRTESEEGPFLQLIHFVSEPSGAPSYGESKSLVHFVIYLRQKDIGVLLEKEGKRIEKAIPFGPDRFPIVEVNVDLTKEIIEFVLDDEFVTAMAEAGIPLETVDLADQPARHRWILRSASAKSQLNLLSDQRSELRRLITPSFQKAFDQLRERTLPFYFFSRWSTRDLVDLLSQLLDEAVYSEKAGILPEISPSKLEEIFGDRRIKPTPQFTQQLGMQVSDSGHVLLDSVWMETLIAKSPRTLYTLLTALEKVQGQKLHKPLVAIIGDQNLYKRMIKTLQMDQKKFGINGLAGEEKLEAKHFLNLLRLKELIEVIAPDNILFYIQAHDYGVVSLVSDSSTETPTANFILNSNHVHEHDLMAIAFLIPALLKAAQRIRSIKDPNQRLLLLQSIIQKIVPGASRQGQAFVIQLAQYIRQVMINEHLIDVSA